MTPFDPRLPIIAAAARVKTCHVFHCWHSLREMGRQFHVSAFATFSGLEEKHVTAILAALEAHHAVPQGGRSTSTRGLRLAPDFKAPDEWIDWAVEKRHWHPDDAREEAELFANYWQSKSGKDACKLDWRKTWQNWVINSRRSDGDYRPPVKMVSHPEHMERTAALYEKMGRTYEAKQIRDELARSSNVVPFNQPGQKLAHNGG